MAKKEFKKEDLIEVIVEEQVQDTAIDNDLFNDEEKEVVDKKLVPGSNTNPSTGKELKAKPAITSKPKDKIPASSDNYPEHVRNLAFLMKNNSEIRRFTAIGIINYLLQKQEIKGEKRYVSFLWNKFQVKVDGLMKEYYYTEPFFLNCLVAAFSSFSASAQKTINTFTKKEMMVSIEKAVDQGEIENIINLSEKKD